MYEIKKQMVTLLQKSAEQIRAAKLPEELAAQLEQCATQVHQPCMVAVVGQVKAGKSTFINAFLGEDLAKVGTTETTATINYFRHGQLASHASVRCVWRNGREDYVDLEFVNSLQGNDIETLRRADGIDHLEYYVLNAYLEQVILVDTPGTEAVVEKHQERTAEFIHLEQQLSKRHSTETQQLGSKADAVIYLIGSTARTSDRTFLEAFQQVTQGQTQAFNAIGVMAKIDLSAEVMQRRSELATKVASQLKASLNTVLPVSAALRRGLHGLLENERTGLRRLIAGMRRIPAPSLEKFLNNEDLFYELDPASYPIPTEERALLLGNLPWTVFTTIARIAANPGFNEDEVIQQVNELAGFDQLKAVLERHFFRRSHLLRCHRILNDATGVLKAIRFKHLPALRQRDRVDLVRQQRYLSFIRQAHGDPATARELTELVQKHLASGAAQVEILLERLERDFSTISVQLERYNADVEALQQITDHRDLFSPGKLGELQALFGLYGMELEKRIPPDRHSVAAVGKCQTSWREISHDHTDPIWREVAQKAVARYGFLLEELADKEA
jgi:GTPase SAR1 family protein